MFINEGIEENLRFLVIEVQKQLDRTVEYIHAPNLSLLDSILGRDDYIDNLKTVIQRKCFSSAANGANNDTARGESLKTVVVVAANLERIADFCEKIVRQLTYIEDEDVLRKYDFRQLFNDVIEGVSMVEDVVLRDDFKTALALCHIENRIDAHYAEMFSEILAELAHGRRTQSLVTTLFIARYLERMGDSLLNIGEAAMSAFLGEQIKIGQYEVLEEILEVANLKSEFGDVSLSAVGETKSGCRIDLVSARNADASQQMVIFKEGASKKLAREKAGVDYWDALMPGIAPAIYAHHQNGDNAALLFEFLDGSTYEQILLRSSVRDMDTAMRQLCETLRTVWRKTQRPSEAPAGFVRQIRDRLDDINSVHPDFASKESSIGGVGMPAFLDLLDQAEAVENTTRTPKQVLVHGDFNIDNVIFDSKTDRIRFIDLHRAAMKDYVQDVSVFLVSNYRLPVFETPLRRRIHQSITSFKTFAADFADEIGDKTFERRLALGVARSFVTSSRFVLDEDFSQDMILRARFLLESVVADNGRRRTKYRLPEEVLIG